MDDSLPKGTEVTVDAYIPEADVFELSLNKMTAVGPNYALPADLKAAVEEKGSLKDFVHKQTESPGSVYVLRKKLKILDMLDMRARAKKLKK